MTKDTTPDRKTYRRDDGALMVENWPGQFVNEEARAANLGFIQPKDTPTQDTSARRQRRKGTSKVL